MTGLGTTPTDERYRIVAILAVVVLAWACEPAGSDMPPVSSDSGTTPEMDAGMAMPPPIGLDERPSNTDCVGTDDPPRWLSGSPCFSSLSPLTAAEGVLPYDIRAPFHTDYYGKDRWLAVPDGEVITVRADGEIDLPPGSVVIKQFTAGERPLETRYLMRTSAGEWRAFSYVWNDAGTDAELDLGGRIVMVEGVPWDIPTETQCFRCHGDYNAFAAAIEVGQVNMDFTYPSTGRTANQLRTWWAIGLASNLPAAPEELLALPGVFDPAETVENRARSYLHSNCNHCHRPGGMATSSADFRFEATDLGVCNVEPFDGDMGVPGAKLLVPGDTSMSLISLRLHDSGEQRMPPLGTRIPDDPGIALIDEWIASLEACP